MWKFPNCGGGGRGSAAWELFPHNPVFLSENVPYSNVHFRPIYLSASSSLLPRFIFGPQDPGFEFRSQLHGNKLVKLRRGDELKKTRSQTNSQIKRKLSSPSSQPKLLQYWFPWKLGWSTFLYIWNWCNSWYSYGWKWTHLGIPIPEFHRFRNGLEYIPKGLPMGLMRYHTSYISRFLVFWMFVKLC